VSLDGPPLRLGPRAAVSLAMALQELATNAAKHGALSRAGGRVALTWRAQPEGAGSAAAAGTGDPAAAAAARGMLVWQETGGPPATAPDPEARRGFGMRLLTQGLRQDLGAGAEISFAPQGLRCVIRVPLGA
jgi:two-component sensor histidine kinase